MAWILLAMLLCVLNVVDAVLSFSAVGQGIAYELNPVWASWMLDYPYAFFITKSVSVVLFATMLAAVANLEDPHRRVATVARYGLSFVTIAYAAIILWHLIHIFKVV